MLPAFLSHPVRTHLSLAVSLQILIADLLQPVRAQAWLCQQVPPWEPHISGQSLVCQIVASEIFVKKRRAKPALLLATALLILTRVTLHLGHLP